MRKAAYLSLSPAMDPEFDTDDIIQVTHIELYLLAVYIAKGTNVLGSERP